MNNALIEQFIDRIMDGYYHHHDQGRELAHIDLEEVIIYTIDQEIGPVAEELVENLDSLKESIKQLKEKV